MVAQAARTAKVFDLPQLQFVGPDDIRNELESSRELRRLLLDLLQRAGVVRPNHPIQIRACTCIQGTPHTKGLKLKSPDNHSVQLTWHEGSNDRCILFRITTPVWIDGIKSHHDFDKHLRDALARAKQEREAPKAPPKAADTTAKQPSADAKPREEPSRNVRASAEVMELLLVHLLEEQMIVEGGKVARHKLHDVLVDKFGFARETLGPTMRSFIAAGHFAADEESKDNFFVVIGDVWMGMLPEKLRAKVPPKPANEDGSYTPLSPEEHRTFITAARKRSNIVSGEKLAKVRVKALLRELFGLDTEEASIETRHLMTADVFLPEPDGDFYVLGAEGKRLYEAAAAPSMDVPAVGGANVAPPDAPPAASRSLGVDDLVRAATAYDEAKRLRDRLAAIADERKPFEARIARAQVHLNALDAEAVEIEAKLAKPEIAEAELLLKAIEAKLK